MGSTSPGVILIAKIARIANIDNWGNLQRSGDPRPVAGTGLVIG
jgi:hypothetical protein